MPFVKIQYRYGGGVKLFANELYDMLAEVVAAALTCSNPNGKLVASDVDVEVVEMSSDFRTRCDICITVEANDFPERRADLELRGGRILQAIQRLQASKKEAPTVSLWVRLSPAFWGMS